MLQATPPINSFYTDDINEILIIIVLWLVIKESICKHKRMHSFKYYSWTNVSLTLYISGKVSFLSPLNWFQWMYL
jgi:hypothetical protein